MSGRFPKCLTPGCRRLLIKKNGSQQLTCGGCQQTFQVTDLINVEQKASSEKNTSDVYLKNHRSTSQPNMLPSEVDDDRPRSSSSNRTYPIGSQKYPNVFESLRGHNRDSTASSIGSDEYVLRKRPEETVVPSARRPGSYDASASSRSTSSDGGSTISRNTHAVSRRTHKREVSTASIGEIVGEIQIRDGNFRYVSNYEEDKIKPGFGETNYALDESKMDQRAGRVRGRNFSEQEIEESEHDFTFNGTYQRGRDFNSSFDETPSSRNRYIPFRHKSMTGEEVEEETNGTNYPLNEPKINLNTKRDSIDSMRNSIISEEDVEERAYPRGRNTNASFDGSISSRSFSSDEGGSRIGTSETRFNSRRTYRSHGSSNDSTNEATYLATQHRRVEQQSVLNQQNELYDLVNELAKMGITREKLIMALLTQTEASIKASSMPQGRNTRSLVRKLSVQIPTPPPAADSGSSRGRRRPAMHHCRPVMGGTPFVTCQSCAVLLQLPIGMRTQKFVKIRCGECSETRVYPFPAKGTTYNPLHKEMGYESARFLLAPSRQFSLMDDDGIGN